MWLILLGLLGELSQITCRRIQPKNVNNFVHIWSLTKSAFPPSYPKHSDVAGKIGCQIGALG